MRVRVTGAVDNYRAMREPTYRRAAFLRTMTSVVRETLVSGSSVRP